MDSQRPSAGNLPGSLNEDFYDLLQPSSGSEISRSHDNINQSPASYGFNSIKPSFDFQPRPSSVITKQDEETAPSWTYEQRRDEEKYHGTAGHLESLTTAPERRVDLSSAPRPLLDKAQEEALLSAVELTMKKYADNLVKILEDTTSRLHHLESVTLRLEKALSSVQQTALNSHGETDGRLRGLENALREIQRGVQVIRDRQEIAEAQAELAKLTVVPVPTAPNPPKEPESHLTPAPTSVAPPPPVQPPPPPPPQPQPQPLPEAPVAPNPPLYLSAPTAPSAPQPPAPYGGQTNPPPVSAPPQQWQGQGQEQLQQKVQSYPQQYSHESYQAPPPPPPPPQQQQQQQLTRYPSPQSVAPQQYPSLPPQQQYTLQPAPQQFSAPPPQQQDAPPASAYSSSYGSAPPQQGYPALPPPQSSAPPSAVYESLNFPRNDYSVTNQPPPRSPYDQVNLSRPGSPGHYGSSQSYRVAQPVASAPSSGSAGYPRLQIAQPVSGSAPPPVRSAGPGGAPPRSSVPMPMEKVIQELQAMGFSREEVKVAIRKVSENGQGVDLNAVLDKLMNGDSKGGWFGR